MVLFETVRVSQWAGLRLLDYQLGPVLERGPSCALKKMIGWTCTRSGAGMARSGSG